MCVHVCSHVFTGMFICVHMNKHMSVFMCVLMCMHIAYSICVYTFMCVYMGVFTCICMWVCICSCKCMHVCLCIHRYIHVCLCIHACAFTCIYVCMHIFEPFPLSDTIRYTSFILYICCPRFNHFSNEPWFLLLRMALETKIWGWWNRRSLPSLTIWVKASEPTWWKEKSDSQGLSSDLYICATAHTPLRVGWRGEGGRKKRSGWQIHS